MISTGHTQKLRDHYRSALFDDIVPWWEKHSIDLKNGGYLTRLERDGHAYSGDKDIWMTGRQIWMFSHLYNNYKKEERWRGGIRYLTNIDSTPSHNLEADMKLWWPHTEALYALLLGWIHTGRDDLKAWYEKVHDYTFMHFPDPEYGEWFGYLNRDGSPVWTAKANGWKGFFHLPRILFRCYQLLSKQEYI